jgi:hypothetical protein
VGGELSVVRIAMVLNRISLRMSPVLVPQQIEFNDREIVCGCTRRRYLRTMDNNKRKVSSRES